MPLNLASPGIVVREVDLTIGRVDPVSGSVGALVAPFAKGPVDLPQLIENEDDLLDTFGRPYSVDKHYEHWIVASSYLAYGGTLRVSRADDQQLKNAFVGAASSVKIKSTEHYEQLGYDENTITNVTVAARNPGTWANGIKVAIIDGKADQILTGINTTSVLVGMGITAAVPSGLTLPGAGTTSVLDGYFQGVITEIGTDQLSVKMIKHVSVAGSMTDVDYQQNGVYALPQSGTVTIRANDTGVGVATIAYTAEKDWFENQSIALSVGSLEWDQLANRPGTSEFAAARGGRFDEVHVVVIDSLGTISGNAGTILEKHLSLSKAKDAEFSVGSPSYWRSFLANNSEYVFGLGSPANTVETGYSSNFALVSNGGWDRDAEGTIFNAAGSSTDDLTGGTNYGGKTDLTKSGALTASIGELSDGYDLFESTDNYKADFLLMGSASKAKVDTQALANKVISVAELRKDAVAFVSPSRDSIMSDTTTQGDTTVYSASDITNKLIEFYASVSSSSYAIFDSGYKYMYDRFSNTFRYVPLNGDIAGICARTDINNFPWYSPAGTSRGSILNAVKLAYNPTKAQRDRLYSNRINPVVFSPGAGIVLFGDKTGLAKASAFDRINVRRLFIYLENAISAAAKDQLFEFNDEITRTNFVNVVEPFLRDVQSNRGIQDYVVICDETNNTAAVIDNNEFVADIFIKPARSINFIGLTFVATKTGVDFEEVIGNF